jgi:hypothetical protein
MPKQFEVWVILCLLKRKMGRCAPGSRQSQLHYYPRDELSILWKSTRIKEIIVPEHRTREPASHKFYHWAHWAIGNIFTKLEMAAKSLLGEQIRQTQ